jgi:hypothetical protein
VATYLCLVLIPIKRLKLEITFIFENDLQKKCENARSFCPTWLFGKTKTFLSENVNFTENIADGVLDQRK